jgi:dihydrodipicolinate synthase/N-acetylneuraminate lyase
MSQPLQGTYRAGVYAPVLTPFKLDAPGALNLELFAVMVNRLAEAGVGLIVGGMNNEAPLLSVDERITLVKQARETVNSLQPTKPVPILAAILGSDLQEYMQMAVAAAGAGADAMYGSTPLPSFTINYSQRSRSNSSANI